MVAVLFCIETGLEGVMGIEHRMKDETQLTQRCPWCMHVSMAFTEDGEDRYFYCQNPRCDVERIYGDNAVMASGHSVLTESQKHED